MINTLYVFANMGHLDQLPKSGGQSSARRVMKGFEEEGIRIVPIRRHRAEAQTPLGHKLEVKFFALFDLLKMIIKMLFGNRKNSAFIQFSYSGTLVPYELLLTKTAHLLGYRSLFYLKGGKVMDTYPAGDIRHKAQYKQIMDLQEMVLFEGQDALELTRPLTNTKLAYFPNYIFDKLIPESVPQKPEGEINLCYFGRTCAAKNPILIVEAFNLLCKRHPERQINLTMVGSHFNKSFMKKYMDAIEESPYRDRIMRKDNSPYEYLVEMMQKQHFYLFPTAEKAEGHSNSVTEAMSQGLIPVASDYHFNKAIVGDERLVVKEYEAAAYADKIDYIVDNVDMKELSLTMWRRVKDNYAYSIVNKAICDQIKSL